MRGEDGTTVKSAAVCHTDTSDWDPNNMALRILNIKAGSTHPVCHFFPEERGGLMATPRRIHAAISSVALLHRPILPPPPHVTAGAPFS
ncbi:BURP domain-containing protein 17 [Acorus calamus]|uniref:BURP domain-containing protein 17 n=1 Tax=Acorus calamus TaxID=4465 RepID=A0AAV9D806_ACOCL|nr:BURP domain-containing protein 17 [Acorus calamus]